MSAKKILLLTIGDGGADPGDGLEAGRLAEALRAKGAVVEESMLGGDPGQLLDRLQNGVVPVVFDGGRLQPR